MIKRHHSANWLLTEPSICLIVLFLLASCASVKKVAVDRDITSILNNSEVFSNQFTGFSLFDLESNEYIADYNSTLLFTPASNVKLLTMYSALKTFNDSIPALIYEQIDDRTVVQSGGDPSFLYSPFKTQRAYAFLNQQKHIEIVLPKHQLAPFGHGWAWDDYNYDFQPERSWWPIYGNAVSITKEQDSVQIHPSFFTSYTEILSDSSKSTSVEREMKFNLFKAFIENDTSSMRKVIPFEYSNELLLQLLGDTLKVPISITDAELLSPDTLFSQHLDTVLAAMMKPSDNFLAEQLLILAAWKNGYSEVSPFIQYVRNVWLSDLNDMVWVDGSGLSRYNLIAPVDQVRLLRKCIAEFGWERTTNILASGGEGTLKEWYLSDEPYLFAKTGTLSNNHNLSGFLITKSGKKLAFSLMNNHYMVSTTEVKEAMQEFILKIRDTY